ncbi:nmrA-like family domain-containing protein 1 [Ambystoma mexicanum]|uniref:nmrA-like family domain-containing protein 1 n=1 Tax=Ambystoma mexicanum TaxID=8296 RepID=UPI0037E8DD58
MEGAVVVIGADSREGQSVVAALVQDPRLKVRAAFDDMSNPQATTLSTSGVDIVQFDPQDGSSVDAALKGMCSSIIITTTNFQDADPLKGEIRRGYSLADGCKRQGVRHVVFLGQHHVHRQYGLPSRHMDAKASINDYMNEIALPKTEVILPYFFEDILLAVKPSTVGHNAYKLALPMGDTGLDGISLTQVGPVVASIIHNPRRWIGKSCSISADRLTIHEYAVTLSRLLHPAQFKDDRISVRAFVETHRGPESQDLGNMFEFWKKGSQQMSKTITAELCNDVKCFHTWVSENKDHIRHSLNIS